MKPTAGRGADASRDCVGWQAHDPERAEPPELAINDVVRSVRATGHIGTVGVYVPSDPGSPDRLGRDGKVGFDLGLYFQKGLSMDSGQANVKAYNRQLYDRIHAGRAEPRPPRPPNTSGWTACPTPTVTSTGARRAGRK